MRDAQSMLEQVLAFSGGTATDSDIKPIMGLRGSEIISRLATAIIAGKEADVIGLTGEAFDGGVDPLDLVASLTEWIRYLLVASIDGDSRELHSLTDETRKELAEEVTGVTTEHMLSLLSMIADAESTIKRATHQRYLLELRVLLQLVADRVPAHVGKLDAKENQIRRAALREIEALGSVTHDVDRDAVGLEGPSDLVGVLGVTFDHQNNLLIHHWLLLARACTATLASTG